MRAEIKELHCPEVIDLKNFYPSEPDNFCLFIQILVGPSGQKGDEAFNITVCTPKWMEFEYKEREMIFGLYHLIVFEYNYDKIYEKLKKYVERFDEPDWASLAKKIGRIAHWEFEDYKPQI